MNISENLYNGARAGLMGAAAGKQTAGNSFFESMEAMKRELADPESDFYREMYQTMQQTVRDNAAPRKADAGVDARLPIVDNMTGTAAEETGPLNARTGTELGLAQDGDPREPLTTEMLAFLAVLGGRETFQIVEDEEDEVQKTGEINVPYAGTIEEKESSENEVRETSESDALYAGAAERRELSDEEIRTLAEKYDPDDEEDYYALVDELARLGVISRDEARFLGRGDADSDTGVSGSGNSEPFDIPSGWIDFQPMNAHPYQVIWLRHEQTPWQASMAIDGIAVGPDGKAEKMKLWVPEGVRVCTDIRERMRAAAKSEADSTVQPLPEERIAALAERYDPHHMEQSEFVEFMDTLAAEGAMRPEDAEAIRNTGGWKVTVGQWRLEDGNGRVIDSGTGWTSPVRMDQMTADSRLMPCLYDGGEDDGDVLAWARLGVRSAYSEGFQALVDILERMEAARAQETAEI